MGCHRPRHDSTHLIVSCRASLFPFATANLHSELSIASRQIEFAYIFDPRTSTTRPRVAIQTRSIHGLVLGPTAHRHEKRTWEPRIVLLWPRACLGFGGWERAEGVDEDGRGAEAPSTGFMPFEPYGIGHGDESLGQASTGWCWRASESESLNTRTGDRNASAEPVHLPHPSPATLDRIRGTCIRAARYIRRTKFLPSHLGESKTRLPPSDREPSVGSVRLDIPLLVRSDDLCPAYTLQ